MRTALNIPKSLKKRDKDISEREVVADDLPKYGTGDHEFVAALGAMPDHVMRAGEEILERVRERFPDVGTGLR